MFSVNAAGGEALGCDVGECFVHVNVILPAEVAGCRFDSN